MFTITSVNTSCSWLSSKHEIKSSRTYSSGASITNGLKNYSILYISKRAWHGLILTKKYGRSRILPPFRVFFDFGSWHPDGFLSTQAWFSISSRWFSRKVFPSQATVHWVGAPRALLDRVHQNSDLRILVLSELGALQSSRINGNLT